MIDTQAIRKKVLDLALRGKLTEQLPEDGTAEEILSEIQQVRILLEKSGRIKAISPMPIIQKEETPFILPNGWAWERLINLYNFIDYRGSTPNKIKSGIPFVTAKNVRQGYIDYSIKEYISETDYNQRQSRGVSHRGDILFTTEAPMGYAAIADLETFSAGQRLITLQQYEGINNLENKFFMYCIAGQFFQQQLAIKCSGTTVKGIKADRLKQFIVPVPPLSEQHRIVKMIDSVYSVLDTIDTLQSKYQDNLATLKSKLIDAGIQGKLTEQLPEDGTAEELYQQIQQEKAALEKAGKIKKSKPLPPISEEEKPFDIPESWMWVKWGDIINIVSARRVHQSDWKSSGIPFYRAREIAKLAENGYVENDLYISEELYQEYAVSGVPCCGDLMVSAVGTLGKTYVVRPNDKFYYKDASVLCFENYGKLNSYYLSYLMRSEFMKKQIDSNSGGTTVDTLTMIRMIQYLLPLPPLAEQKRIVAKLEELLPLCES